MGGKEGEEEWRGKGRGTKFSITFVYLVLFYSCRE